MTDEKIIYLGPEEELTSVRERLEQTDARRIVLVIPPQTQLRHLLGWRLLHSRMRELGKDVLVISSDRQVRAVAKEAGFRIADSLESPPSNSLRSGSHPSRAGTSGKTQQRSRNQPGRGKPENRTAPQRQQSNQSQVATNERQQMRQSRPETSSRASRADETNTGAGAASSTYGARDVQLSSPFDLHIDTSPSVRPLVPEQEDDEPDSLTADFDVAQRIREAAQSSNAGAVPAESATREPVSGIPGRDSIVPPPNSIDGDLFAYMEDLQPASLPEQRGSTHIEDIDSGIPDISDFPTDELEPKIEDLGDEGEILFQQDAAPRAWSEPVVEEPGVAEMPRVYGTPPRANRSRSVQRLPIQDIDDEDKLLPASDQPARTTPSAPAQARSSSAAKPPAAGDRGPQPIIQPQTRNVSTTPPQPKTRKTTKASQPTPPLPANRRASLTSDRKNGRIAIIAIISLVVLVLAVLAFLLFGSNATVTVTVVTQSSSLTNLHYVASTNPYDAAHNTIASQVLTYTASVPGQGTATGVTQQGNSFAAGTVIFTNKGSQPVDIPTGTVISTGGGIGTQFVTTADTLVQPVSSGFPAPPVPVQAQTPGTSGNVPANTITIVPATSLQSIAAAQNPAIPTSSVILSVMNPTSTSGGGAANVQQVTSKDVAKLTKALHPKLQAQIAGWLAKVLQPQDVGGKMIPDVMGSPNPLPEEKLVANPQVGQVVASGQFTGVLSVSVKILVIRAATIQAVSKARINAQAVNMSPPHILAAQRPLLISKMKSTPSADGTTLTLTWTATGQIMPQVSAQKVSNLAAGKGVNQARSDIMNSVAGATDTRIDIFPSFLGIVPFRSEQIHVIMQPGPLIGGTPNG